MYDGIIEGIVGEEEEEIGLNKYENENVNRIFYIHAWGGR
jgi:hypothetical protein